MHKSISPPRHGALLAIWLILSWLPSFAFGQSVESLLAAKHRPVGVVFEIVEADLAALSWAIPQVRADIDRLQLRFANLPVAVVSHGREQFALTKAKATQFPTIHAEIQQLNTDDVPVHICATHASWYGVQAEDFPAYVDVAAAGPAQVADYENLGYSKIWVEKYR